MDADIAILLEVKECPTIREVIPERWRLKELREDLVKLSDLS